MALEQDRDTLLVARNSSGPSPPSSDLDMLAHLAGSLSKCTLPIKEELHIPFTSNQLDFGSGNGDGKRDSRTPTTSLPNTSSRSIVYRSSVPIHPTSHSVILPIPYIHFEDKGNLQATVDSQLQQSKRLSHRKKNGLKLLTTLEDNCDASDSLLLTNSEKLQHLHRSYQATTPLKNAIDIKNWSRGVAPCAPRQKKGNRHPSLVLRAPPLAAAKRLAKLCQDTKPLFKHKAFLFPSIHAVPTCRTALSAPLVSKHLKGRRARGDSYSSSSSESTGHTSNKMARQLGSMYDTLQGGISRLTEDLASSLHLEKTSSNNVAGYITSPSATSTYSNHSLFSEQSHISSHTNHSSRQASDSDHCMIRNATAHPSAQRILSLHHHSPESTPRKPYVQAAPSTYRLFTHHMSNICPPLDDPRSRYFARRNAIAPLADVDTPQQRSGVSSFGPVRTSRPLKTARTPFATSHLTVPYATRPYSPPPVPSNNKMKLSYLIVPSRRSTMPALHSNEQLGSPMRLASSPRPKLAECTNLNSPRIKMDMDMDMDDDLDFCCKGYESPAVTLDSPPRSRPSHLFMPYRRNNAGAATISQLSKRRGKMIASLELR